MPIEYVSVDDAIARSGLRMVVVGGVPSPWGEAAKGILHIKRIPWCAVRLSYDSEPLRTLLRWLGIEPHIAKRRTEHGSGLGKVRWVVERTISWLKGLRRMRVRYDRLGVIMDAWATLAASVICFRILHHDII